MKNFRIGQIVPSSNTTMETEIPAMLTSRYAEFPDERFTFHSARMRMMHVTPEELKAVSMNLGHSSVRTTIDDYGQLSPQRQGEVLKALRKRIREAEGLG